MASLERKGAEQPPSLDDAMDRIRRGVRDMEFWRIVDAFGLDPENLPGELAQLHQPDMPYERYRLIQEAAKQAEQETQNT